MKIFSIDKILKLFLLFILFPAVSWANTNTGSNNPTKPETKTNTENSAASPKEELEANHTSKDMSYEDIQQNWQAPTVEHKAAPSPKVQKEDTEQSFSHNYLFYLIYKFKYCNVFEKEELTDYPKK